MFDTWERIEAYPRLKKGCLTAAAAHAYISYKLRVKKLFLRELCAVTDRGESGDGWEAEVVEEGEGEGLEESTGEAEYGGLGGAVSLKIQATRDGRLVFVEPARRLGFALAVRSALRLAETPFVWVQQHDWALAAPIPLAALLDVMAAPAVYDGSSGPPTPPPPPLTPPPSNPEEAAAPPPPPPPIKYVCLPSVRMLSYPTSKGTAHHPMLQQLTALLQHTFMSAARTGGVAIPLTPIFLWHDKPHVAATAHYLARVFPTRLAVARGDFIEDTVGQRARSQMKAGHWHRWACWLYFPDCGKTLCLRHLKGRTWRGAEAEAALVGARMAAGRAAFVGVGVRALGRGRDLESVESADEEEEEDGDGGGGMTGLLFGD